MRLIPFAVVAAFVAGACSLYITEDGSGSPKGGPTASGGGGGGGKEPPPDAGKYIPDADFTFDGGKDPLPDAWPYYPDAETSPVDAGSACGSAH